MNIDQIIEIRSRAYNKTMEIRNKARKQTQGNPNKKATKEERGNKTMTKELTKRDALVNYANSIFKRDELTNETRQRLSIDNNNPCLIPTDLSKEIIIGMQNNPVLKDITIKNINNFATPRASLIEKDGTGEIEFTYDMLEFDRIKKRLITYINENNVTSNADKIIEFTQDTFKELLSDFTIKTMFDKSNELSIFNNKEVEKITKGKDYLESISKSLESLPKNFRNKASLVVNTSTYMEIAILLGKLNLSSLLNDKKSIYGKIKICDYLENGEMIFGDLSQLCFNYHWITQDSDKDLNTGVYIVALATTYDFKILLPKLIKYIGT